MSLFISFPILLLFFAFIWFLLAGSAGHLADRYGRSYLLWLLFGLVLSPLVAILMLWCLGPDEDQLRKQTVDNKTHKRCIKCEELTLYQASVCKHCGHEFACK